jgi:hypothetical protein
MLSGFNELRTLLQECENKAVAMAKSKEKCAGEDASEETNGDAEGTKA